MYLLGHQYYPETFFSFPGKKTKRSFRNKIGILKRATTHAEAVPPVSREALEISSLCRGVQQ